ncbi:hypothetical protein FISHEDRAFT_54337 [Fistulina hepatica ATCC 64428]|uniref:WW domain-containing protein n=1 Tax=Fistulina hepatica ATCC 64428 TaxID=1128425 RepID=A0A0D7A0N7_9AGAR|nr:hypothetical protein FISHEDRAFT_54337 [Fistulina hepatica ATCC 64428]
MAEEKQASPEPETVPPADETTHADTEAEALRSTATTTDNLPVDGPVDNREARDSDDEPAGGDAPQVAPTAWQAVWAPQYNAYYFYNAQTGETTWTNPLQAEVSASTSGSMSNTSATPAAANSDDAAAQAGDLQSTYTPQQLAALQEGIDPYLAYLDPSLGVAGPSAETFQARFNARTGAFTAMDARDPSHLSEYERAKRMSEVFFDVNKWESDLQAQHAQEKEESGKKRKRPSKKDLERFKEQKRQKKIAKTAWLRT